jgi:hypothetical protein
MYKFLLVIIFSAVGISGQAQDLVHRTTSESILIVPSKHHTDLGTKKNVLEYKSPKIASQKKDKRSFPPLEINRPSKKSVLANITRSQTTFHNKKITTIRSKDSIITKGKAVGHEE